MDGTKRDTTVQSTDVMTEDGSEVDQENASSTAPTVSYDEMMSTRDTVVETLEAEMLNESTSDELYMVLREAATAVSKDLSERPHSKGLFYEYDADTVVPASVIAMERSGTTMRVVRNEVRNPGFCPNTVKVLNEGCSQCLCQWC